MTAKGRDPRLVDCFLFHRELDILEIRLREHWPLVRKFVLVESTTDFAGNPKPLLFADNAARFSEFAPKIQHVIVRDGPPDTGQRFAVQHHQRDRMAGGVADAAPDDPVMISDVDEILRREALEGAIAALARRPLHVVFRMQHHSMRLNLIHPGKIITGPRMVRARHFRTPHLVRRLKSTYWKGQADWLDQIPARFNAWRACGRPIARLTVPESGWHLSSVGDTDLLDAKARAFDTDEIGMRENRTSEAFAEALSSHADLARTFGLQRVGLDTLPGTVSSQTERWRHLIAGPAD